MAYTFPEDLEAIRDWSRNVIRTIWEWSQPHSSDELRDLRIQLIGELPEVASAEA